MRLLTREQVEKCSYDELIRIANDLGIYYADAIVTISGSEVIKDKASFISMILGYNDRLIAIESSNLAKKSAKRALIFMIFSAIAAAVSAGAAVYSIFLH